MIKMKIKSEIATSNEKTAPLMQYYNDQGKFYAVNGSIQEIARLSTVIDNL
jgi:adenylate kinase